FTPGGVESLFASGLGYPSGLAFDSAGDLFVANQGLGNGAGYITEITPNGTESTFASGLDGPEALAFNNAGDLFETDAGDGIIYEFSPSGSRTTFVSGFNNPAGLAFQGGALPVPEPSTVGLFVAGAAALLVCRHWRVSR
ncbi:MAG: PEP-CTERM sorting domain-containing protein, partial [Limisphaerales bacterium]